MIELHALLAIIWLHWLGDFVFQTDKMAKNKSKDSFWLLAHCGVYCLYLLPLGFTFAVVNAVAHFCVDFWSSRLSSKMWAQGRTHDFFVVVGADQAIHATTLFVTYTYLVA